MDEEVSEFRQEAEARIEADPIAHHLFNPAQIRAIAALEDVDPEGVTIIVSTMGNGGGKTFVHHGAIAGAIMMATANPLFATQIVTDWPFPKSARLMGPAELTKDKGPIQKAIRGCWPAGQYKQRRGAGKGFYNEGETETGWDWDVITYNQTALQGAGATKGLIVCTEPPPEHLFGEIIGRLRAGGVLLIEMTPLDYAAYLEELTDDGVLKDEEGNVVAKVMRIRGDIHDNCRDCHEGGQLPHRAIMGVIAAWPVEEREARRTGDFMTQQGRIYKKWGVENGNVLEEMPEYHQECFDKGLYNLTLSMDPHDRKPYALIWVATFPNDDAIVIAEWPDDSYMPFHKLRSSPVTDTDEYREIVQATENQLEKMAEKRYIDPNFGNTPMGNGKSVKQIFASDCGNCRDKKTKCTHRFHFIDPPGTGGPGSLATGHLEVRKAIGNKEEKVRPKLFAMSYCENFNYGMRRYGYKENKIGSDKGVSERPELINKDFPDTIRQFYLAGGHKYRDPQVAAVVNKLANVGKRGRRRRGRRA